MVLLKSEGVGEHILPILIDLAIVARPLMFNAVAFHGEPIVADSHNFLSQQESSSMGSK